MDATNHVVGVYDEAERNVSFIDGAKRDSIGVAQILDI
jgi:hypothetical protein